MLLISVTVEFHNTAIITFYTVLVKSEKITGLQYNIASSCICVYRDISVELLIHRAHLFVRLLGDTVLFKIVYTTNQF